MHKRKVRYMFKVNNVVLGFYCYLIFIDIFLLFIEHILHLFFSVSVIDFEQEQ